MIELFKHIFELDFDWLFTHYGTAVYLILFLVIFIETGLVVMPFLPGDSLLFTAGLFAKAGLLDLTTLLILLYIAAVVGDNCNYWVGRKIGLGVLSWKIKNRKLVKKKYLDKTEEFFEKNGVKADARGLQHSSDIIQSQIQALMGRALYGNEGFYSILNNRDKAIKKAIDLLNSNKLVSTSNKGKTPVL